MHPDEQIHSDTKRQLGLNILLVDDHALNRFMVQTILEKWSCNIIIAKDGLEAVRQMIDNPGIELILMDMRMPVMDGKTASEFIRTRMRSSIPIIAITSDAIQYANGEGEKAITYFISKPFTQEELYDKSRLALKARIPELPASCMDLASLLNEGGDNRFIARMIDLFLEDTPEKIDAIYQAIEMKDQSALMDIAHTIKPSLRYLASASVSETAMNVEKNASDGNLIYAESLLLVTELSQLSEELKIFRLTLD